MASSCASCAGETGQASGESCQVLSSKSDCPLSAARIWSWGKSGMRGKEARSQGSDVRKCKRRLDLSLISDLWRLTSTQLILHLNILVAVARAAGAEPGIDEAVKVAVEHALRVARAHAGAQVLHHLIRLQHVAADLAAPADLALLAVKPLHLRALLVEFLFVEPRLEDVQC